MIAPFFFQEENKENISFDQEESKDNFYYNFDNESFEHQNDNNQIFNDNPNSCFYDMSFDPKNCITEEDKDDKFNGEFCLEDDYKKYKTEMIKNERTRDTETKEKDKKYKVNNGKDSEEIFNQEKENVNIIKEENSINGVNSKNAEKIFSIIKEYKRKNGLGRKKKNNFGGNRKHDKFSLDNIVRKVKSNAFEIIRLFINLIFIPIEIENPNVNSKKKKFDKPFLVKIDQEIITNINVEDNLELLDSTLKDIFSKNTSQKYKHLGLDKNKKVIEEIYEQKIQKRAISILNKTFCQCLEYISGINYDEDLVGLEIGYQRIIKEMRKSGESEEYISEFENMVKNFKSYYTNKKARKKKL